MVAFAFALALSSCSFAKDQCASDADCPDGYHCVVGTGVCVRMTIDASVPDFGDAGSTD